MNEIIFGKNQRNKHQCQAKKEGEWVVFRCPQCPDYERRIHVKTGKMTSKSINNIQHTGSFIPFDHVNGLGVN